MRSVILLDLKIDKDEALALLDDFGEFFEKHTGIECEWYVERRDFSVVPTVPDSDGDLKPTKEYRKALETDVHNRYGDYGTDNIVMWVHEDNFLYKRIWGSNWSYNFYKYSFQLCRWDKDNPVNTFNTLFHEGGPGHSADALVREELAVDLNEKLAQHIWQSDDFSNEDKQYVAVNGFDWDKDYIHGKLPSVQYMGKRGYTYSEDNLRPLKVAAPLIAEAYALRKEKHLERIGIMKRIIQILSTIVSLLGRKG